MSVVVYGPAPTETIESLNNAATHDNNKSLERNWLTNVTVGGSTVPITCQPLGSMGPNAPEQFGSLCERAFRSRLTLRKEGQGFWGDA